MTNTFIYSQFIEDTLICDELIEFFHQEEKCHRRGTMYDKEGKDFVDLETKDSYDLVLYQKYIDTELLQRYLVELGKVCHSFKSLYPDCSDYVSNWAICEPFNIQYYKPGGGFKGFHCERVTGNSFQSRRHLTFMTYLNTVEDQGETEFKNQNLKIKPEKGKTVIWPTDWTHTHRGVVSPTEEKYIITGWYSFLQ